MRGVVQERYAEPTTRRDDLQSRRLLENMPVAAYTCDSEGLITFFNRFAAELWGREPLLHDPEDRFCGSFRLFSPDGSPIGRERCWMARALHEGRDYCGQEIVIERPDGSHRNVLAHATPIRHESGRLSGALNVLVDITSQKRAEEELRLRDRAIESLTQGVCITDATRPDNPIVHVNQGFVGMTGYAPDEVLGRNCRFLQGPKTDPAAVATMRAAISEARACLVELLNYRKDGTPFWNAVSLTPVHDAGGRLTHFVGVQTDITPFKRLEEQLRQSQKLEAVGQLASGVAHDFNNLLCVINGYSEMLIPTLPRDDPRRATLGEIRHAGERAASLTRQLLVFSRKQFVQAKVVDLNGLVGDTEKMLRRLIGEDIDLGTALDPSVCQVNIDPGHLEQVVINLAVNARDAMPQGGRLTIETRNVDWTEGSCVPDCKPGGYVLLAVTDTGCGMTAEVKERMFEPFFTTKEPGKGTGLGLATVFGIVKQAGGHVAAYSEPGVGTTFKVYLPAVEGPAAASLKPLGPFAARRGSETVLVVEDEPGLRRLACLGLETQGYNVLEAGNGQAGLGVAEAHAGPIHLVITDVVMPEMGGRQLAERLRTRYPGIKILFISGYTDDTVMRHGIIEGSEAFLQKPFTPTVLARKVGEVLEGKS